MMADDDLAQVLDDFRRDLADVPLAFVDAAIHDADVQHDPPDTSMSYLSDGRRRMYGHLRTLWAMARVCRDAVNLGLIFRPGERPQGRVMIAKDMLLTLGQRVRCDTLLTLKDRFTELSYGASWEPELALEIIDRMMDEPPVMMGEAKTMDEIQAADEWNKASARAWQMAKRAETDDAYRAQLCLVVDTKAEVATFAELLRACAQREIPKAFDWAVTETMGGHAFLTLQKINQELT